MTTNIVAALLFVVLVCLLIVGICVLIDPRIKKQEEEKFKLDSKGSMEQFYKNLEPFIEELAFFETFRQATAIETLQKSGKTPICIIENVIKEALEKGIEYKRKYEALSKEKELELRKFCVEQPLNPDASPSDRIKHADLLHQYLTTGKQPENKEEQA